MEDSKKYTICDIFFPKFVPGCTFWEKIGVMIVYYMFLPFILTLYLMFNLIDLGLKIKM